LAAAQESATTNNKNTEAESPGMSGESFGRSSHPLLFLTFLLLLDAWLDLPEPVLEKNRLPSGIITAEAGESPSRDRTVCAFLPHKRADEQQVDPVPSLSLVYRISVVKDKDCPIPAIKKRPVLVHLTSHFPGKWTHSGTERRERTVKEMAVDKRDQQVDSG
jgi:hypothetical protein